MKLVIYSIIDSGSKMRAIEAIILKSSSFDKFIEPSILDGSPADFSLNIDHVHGLSSCVCVCGIDCAIIEYDVANDKISFIWISQIFFCIDTGACWIIWIVLQTQGAGFLIETRFVYV